jgi:hypothetical protein
MKSIPSPTIQKNQLGMDEIWFVNYIFSKKVLILLIQHPLNI